MMALNEFEGDFIDLNLKLNTFERKTFWNCWKSKNISKKNIFLSHSQSTSQRFGKQFAISICWTVLRLDRSKSNGGHNFIHNGHCVALSAHNCLCYLCGAATSSLYNILNTIHVYSLHVSYVLYSLHIKEQFSDLEAKESIPMNRIKLNRKHICIC